MQTREGQTLTEGQLQQLQWVLPSTFNPQLCAFLRSTAVVGAKLRSTVAGVEHWLGGFQLERMLEEVFRSPSDVSNEFPRLLPFAGCGRRRTTIYLVDVTDSNVWLLEPKQRPVSLGVTIQQLWAGSTVEPRVAVRRRLPSRQPMSRPAVSSKRPRQRVEVVCDRTLSLFPSS